MCDEQNLWRRIQPLLLVWHSRWMESFWRQHQSEGLWSESSPPRMAQNCRYVCSAVLLLCATHAMIDHVQVHVAACQAAMRHHWACPQVHATQYQPGLLEHILSHADAHYVRSMPVLASVSGGHFHSVWDFATDNGNNSLWSSQQVEQWHEGPLCLSRAKLMACTKQKVCFLACTK